MRTISGRAAAAALALGLVATGCVGHVLDQGASGKVVITVSAVGTPVATVTVEVSASDISPSLVFNLTLESGTATRTVSIPAGAARALTARAFDTTGAVTHEGSILIDVVPGPNPSVSIPMVPRPGQQPITVQVGPVVVSLAPATTTVAVGATVQLAATVTAANGDGLLVAVEWASDNPARATVDANGLVSGISAGEVKIVGTYAGVAGVSLVTVQ